MNLKLIKEVINKINKSKRNEEVFIEFPKDLDKFTSIILKFILILKIKENYLLKVPEEFIKENFLITNILKFNLDFDSFIKKYDLFSSIKNIILFIVGELFDNIKEHSHSFDVYLGLEKNEEVFLGIFDNGITIFNRYKEAGVEVKDYKEAIKKAIEGISAKSIEERGYGLKTIQKIVKNLKGKMFIFSGEAYAAIDDKEKIYDLDFYFPGTGVILSFPSVSKNLSEIL
jgi:glucose-6-phosphate-specific signal transduction histidine kinase